MAEIRIYTRGLRCGGGGGPCHVVPTWSPRISSFNLQQVGPDGGPTANDQSELTFPLRLRSNLKPQGLCGGILAPSLGVEPRGNRRGHRGLKANGEWRRVT